MYLEISGPNTLYIIIYFCRISPRYPAGSLSEILPLITVSRSYLYCRICQGYSEVSGPKPLYIMIKVYRIRTRYPAGSVSEILLLITVCRIYLLPDTAKVLGSIRTQNSLYNDESVPDPTKVPGLLTLNLIAVCQIYI